MIGAASTVILSFLLATGYGAAFHFIVGGPARHLLLYLPAAWIGFIIGHYAGKTLEIELFQLGTLNLFSASLGSWSALIFSWWLVHPGEDETT